MSKSLNNAIYLSDAPDVLKQKVMSMYTDPNHLKVSDPGQVKGNMVFTYLDAFDTDKDKVKELKEHYTRGGLGDMVLKKYLLEILDSILSPIRTQREYLANNKEAVFEILKSGSDKAKNVASATLTEVRKAIGVNYF